MKKLGIAVAVAAALVLVLFVGIKVVLGSSIPAFQEKSIERIANLSIEYSESSRCQACHLDIYNDWLDSAHKTADCDTCHGPSQAHVDNSSLIVPVDTSGDLCMSCHNKLESKPSTFSQIISEAHYPEKPCLDCHSPYIRPIAESPPVPHTLQGRIGVCLSCHEKGVFRAPKLAKDHVGFTAEMCLNCHKGSVQ
ncbi:MAG: hypothetical protein KJ624_02660 [Chloroflexi bacterium]|nr:hypothetical protein [Chloroflexota bacterium]